MAADVLHHCDKCIQRQVKKLQCALIFAFDLTHQYMIAVFHRLFCQYNE